MTSTEQFTIECIKNIDEIFSDKKITLADIPFLVKLVSNTYNAFETFNLETESYTDIMTGIIIEILKKHVQCDELATMEPVIQASLELVHFTLASNIKVKKCFCFC